MAEYMRYHSADESKGSLPTSIGLSAVSTMVFVVSGEIGDCPSPYPMTPASVSTRAMTVWWRVP